MTAGPSITATENGQPNHFLQGASYVVVVFLASRLIICGVIFLSKLIIVPGKFWHPGGMLETLTHWDGVYYLHIARHGYFHTPGTASTVAFFPVYPLLVRCSALIFHDFRLAAVLTSGGCLLLAGLFLNALIRLDYPNPQVSRKAVTLVMFSPVSFFFSSSYTEATFLLFAVAALYAASKQCWTLASLCGMCLAATRNVGLLVVVPLFIEYLRQTMNRASPLRSVIRPPLFLLALVPGGLFLFMFYGYLKSGDWLAFSHAGADWGRILVSPKRTLATLVLNEPFYQWLFLGALITALLLWIAGLLLRIRVSYLVWAALLITTYLCSNSMEAMPRYLSVIFPLFTVAGLITARFEWSYEPVLGASITLLTICTILSANGYWMT